MRTLTVILALCAACAMAEETSPLKAVSQGTEEFSNNFFKEIASAAQDKNLISSPLSAHIVLSLAALGAGGNTAKQMYQSLHLPTDNAVARSGFQDLISQLNNVENVTLEVANKMYVAKGLKLKSDFKQLSRDSFSSEASEFDASNGAESAKLVNGWVDEKTHHKINKIIKDSDINSDTRMLLLNAIYFKGNWASKFDDKLTRDMPFHLTEKSEKQVPTMFKSGSFIYGELPDLKAKFIELPYENKDLKMVIVVPDEINGLSNLLANLDSLNATRLAKEGRERDVHLYLPKFKIESTIELEEPLAKLGMTDMFTNGANFTGISDEPLKVSKVIQKAFIEVNEEGSEAAAVTASKFMPLSAIYVPQITMLHIDRPFLYSIVHKSAGITLFNGLLNTPIVYSIHRPPCCKRWP